MEAGKKNITGIFNRATKLQVPYFQRSYVWGEEQWDRFLDDMKYSARTNGHYFMGSVILKQQSTQLGEGDVRTIIDGQQRLTTLMLFFKALYIVNEAPEKFQDVFTRFQGDLLIEHNQSDKPVFEKILLDQVNDATSDEKKSKIFQCFEFFKGSLSLGEVDPHLLYGNIFFVGIDLQADEDEQQIFDTINSLGVRLTTAELLKNYLFNRDYQAYEDHWRSVFESDSETREYWDLEVTSGRIKRSNIDLFLQSFLYIKIQDQALGVSGEDKERFFKVESTFNSYKEFIDRYEINKEQITQELKEHAILYRSIIDPTCTERVIARGDAIGRLNLVVFGLETATIIPYLLFVAKMQPDEGERSEIFSYIEKYFMRRLVCKRTAKNYNQLFRSLIGNEVKTVEKMRYFVGGKRAEQINAMPSDANVEDGFLTSQLTNKQAKGVLYLIESAVRSDIHATSLRDFDDYSLEHVLPKKWRNHWNTEGFSDTDAYDRDMALLTLGNLTLITSSLNSAIRDSDWETKKNGSNSRVGLKEFAQGIETFSTYLERDVWDETTILERARELYKYAVEDVWSLGEDESGAEEFEELESEIVSLENLQLYCTALDAASQGVPALGNGITVQKGSKAAVQVRPAFANHNYYNLRAQLMDEGVLVEKDGYLEFTKDYTFSSPSAAAAVVLARAADGPTEWKDESGKSLSLLRDEN